MSNSIKLRGAHSVGGAAPYTVLGNLRPGQSASRPNRTTGQHLAAGDPAWRKVYPVLPCNGIQWGFDGEVSCFSSIVPSANASMFIYAVMTWLFHGAQGATIFSIEKTIDPKTPWLNIFVSDAADWKALDDLFQRLVKAGPNLIQVVQDVCDEVRQ
jgi:hypothetical protein